MVVIHIKKGDSDGFLYETTADTSNDVIIRDIVCIWNLRVILTQLVGGIRTMAQYGPMKKPDKAGLDEIDEKYNGATIDKGQYYCADPTGTRTGNGVGPALTETIERVAVDTEAALDKTLVQRKIATTKETLFEKLDNIRGVVTMAFPMGLPEWDTIRVTIEGNKTPACMAASNKGTSAAAAAAAPATVFDGATAAATEGEGAPAVTPTFSITGEGLDGTAAGQEIMDENTAELWIASRCLDRREAFSVRYGRNEKTKVIAKMQRVGGGAPGREAAVSEEERKAMMAFYFKKQEEMKAIAENNEDDYLNSVWANPKALQSQLRGQSSNVKAPGIR